MRADRAPSGPGLAGMSAIRELDSVRMLRPLLAIPRARLRATLAELGQTSLEDPSNLNDRFERIRLRTGAGFTASHGAHAPVGRRRAECAGARRRQPLGTSRAHRSLGFGQLAAGAMGVAPTEVVIEAMSRLIRSVGGRVYPPSRLHIVRLLDELISGRSPRASLGGCIVERRVAALCR